MVMVVMVVMVMMVLVLVMGRSGVCGGRGAGGVMVSDGLVSSGVILDEVQVEGVG